MAKNHEQDDDDEDCDDDDDDDDDDVRKRKRIHNGVSVSPRRHAPRVQKFGRPPAPYPEGPLGQKLAIISEIAPKVDLWVRNLLVLRFRCKSSRSPGGPKIGWGFPGGLLGVPWGLLGGLWGDDPRGAPPGG